MFMHNMSKMALATAMTVYLAAGLVTANAEEGKADYTKMTANELAEHLIFNTGSFKLDQKVQEGGEARQRLEQDELQKACTSTGGAPVDSKKLSEVQSKAGKSITYPKDGIKLGDWKIGRELAWSGYGYRVGHKTDDHSKTKNGPGGNCYNCHQLATDRTGGTIGPSLTNYGKLRGTSDAIVKHTYNIIYNAHSIFPCTNMPRFGAKELLTTEQISHIMAYLFDPESPVNK